MSFTIDTDFNVIRVRLVQALMTCTGLDQNHVVVLEAEQPNSPRPTLPYLGLKITSPSIKQGDDDRRPVLDTQGNPTSSWTSGGVRKMVVTFDAYGNSHEEAYNLMALVQASLDEENTQSFLRQKGIAVWIIGNVADLSALLNTGYEGRAHMDCQFGIAINLVSDLGEMDTAVINGQVTTDQGNVVPISDTVSD